MPETKRSIPSLGDLTPYPGLTDAWESAPMTLNALAGARLSVMVFDYVADESPAEIDAAIANFLALDDAPLRAAEPHIYRYFLDFERETMGGPSGLAIAKPADVWAHIQFRQAPSVERRGYGDRGVYVHVDAECDWETEHGLEIVFRNGTTVCKVGQSDGHATNGDAFGDPAYEDKVYVSLDDME